MKEYYLEFKTLPRTVWDITKKVLLLNKYYIHFVGDLEKHMDTLTKSEEFFKEYFEENNNTIKCYSGYSKDGRILIYAENKAKENLTLHMIGEFDFIIGVLFCIFKIFKASKK